MLLWGALLALLAWRAGPQVAAALGAGGRGGAAPALAVTTLDGERLSLDEMRGQVVLVNFWATWCPPCRLEMPGFQRVWESRRRRGLVVLGLSRDAGDGQVRRFVAAHGVTYPVAMSSAADAAALGGVRALPTSVLIDREGRVRHRVEGFFAEPALRAAVDRLLDEPVPPPATGGR